MFRKIQAAEYHFRHTEFNEVSDSCKDLIKKLLVVNERKRLSCREALQHAWFKEMAAKQKKADKEGGANTKDRKISDDVLQRLRSFKGVSTFKKAAMNLLIKTASEEEVYELKQAFQQID